VIPTLKHDDIVFMYPSSDPGAYAKYGATVVACAGSPSYNDARRFEALHIHAAASMDCLLISSVDMRANPSLVEASIRDIDNNPVAIDESGNGAPNDTLRFIGCGNHPVFRAYLRKKVCEAMAGNPDGLHMSNHLGGIGIFLARGGCFCDYCLRAFWERCKTTRPAGPLSSAAENAFDAKDFRRVMKSNSAGPARAGAAGERTVALTEYIDFQLSRAAENLSQLHRIARDIVDRPITLSISADLTQVEHYIASTGCAYVTGELPHYPSQGVRGCGAAIRAYRIAEALGRPLAATAAPQDWAYIKENNRTQLVHLWIALAYACGQRFMVPHRTRCFTKEKGMEWYCGSPADYAPVYAFVRKNPSLFNGYRIAGPLRTPEKVPVSLDTHEARRALLDAIDNGNPQPMVAGDHAWVFPRTRSDGLNLAHVLTTAYDEKTGRIEKQHAVSVTLPEGLFMRNFSHATVHAFDAEPITIPVHCSSGMMSMVLPELSLWSIVSFEYWL
jgi:hypothetical protein